MRRWNAKTTQLQLRTTTACLRFGVLLLLVLGSDPVFAGPLAVPHTFTNGEVADADEVNTNFDAVKTEVDDNDVRIDTLLGQSCPAGEVVTGVDASGSIVCTPAPPPVDPTCPAGTNLRTPAQVMQDHRAAIAALDWDAFGCNYDLAAWAIFDLQICFGRTDITNFQMSRIAAFGGANETLVDETIVNNVARDLYTLAGGGLSIADGVSTYVIENGQIQRVTTHGVIAPE